MSIDEKKQSILNQKMRLVAKSTLVIMLTGCAVGPNYDGPPHETYKPLHNVNTYGDNKALLERQTLDAWWVYFNDPELDTIMEQVLKQNLDLVASLARIQQARAVAQYAGAKLLPTLDSYANSSRIRESLENPTGAIASNFPGYNRTVTLNNVGVEASWEIDLFGGLQRGEEAASAEAEVANAAYLGIRVSVSADAADAYFQIRGLQEQLSIVSHMVEINTQVLSLVTMRQTYGIANERDIAHADALLQSSKATIPLLRLALEAQCNRLDVLMGVQSGTYAMKLTPTSHIAIIPELSNSLTVSDLLHRRPDIIVAERKLATANANIGVATSDYYPKFSLSGILGFESMNSHNLFSSSTFQPQVVSGLRWRLFDFGKVDAEVKQAKGAHLEALALYRKSVLRATEDVENAFMALSQYKVQSELLRKKEDALTHSSTLAEAEYKEGIVSSLEVLDTKRELLTANNEHSKANTDMFRSTVASYRSLGGGW